MKLLKVLQDRKRFSITEQSVIDYALAHPEEISGLSARQLGERAFTSSAAVIRLCQKLGLSGYAEFRVRFASEVVRDLAEGRTLDKSITNKDTIRSIMDKVARIEADALEETRSGVDPAIIMRTTFLLEHAEHIDFYAQDNNIMLAQFASYCFMHAQKYSTVHTMTNIQYLQSLSTPATHVAFIISRTGENRQLIEMARNLRKQKNSIILLTSVEKSTLTGLADEVINVASADNFNELGSVVFLVGAKYIMEVLFGTLMAHHYQKALTMNEIYEQMFYI
jgi:DNA-binding MurR/RpiR family transcriptional regulator